MNVSTRYIFLLALCASLLASCQQIPIFSPATTTPEIDPEVEEYAVYNALLEHRFSSGSTNQVLIMDHTRVNNPDLLERDLVSFQENFPVELGLIDNFKDRNQQPHPLEPTLEISLEYQLLSQGEVDELRPQDEASGWKLFYELYPETVGFLYLSRVGFSSDFNQALVYLEWYHYDQPIQGGYYLFTRQDGGWEFETGYQWET